MQADEGCGWRENDALDTTEREGRTARAGAESRAGSRPARPVALPGAQADAQPRGSADGRRCGQLGGLRGTRSRIGQAAEELPGGRGDLVHGPVEDLAVDLGRLAVPADLPHELERRGSDVLVGEGFVPSQL